MAQPASRKSAKPAKATAAARSESATPLLASLAAVAVLVAGLLMAKAAGASWLEWADNTEAGGSQPRWMNPETVRATSADGQVVRAKVVVDAPDADTRALLTRRAGQVSLLLQVSVAEHERGDAAGGERIEKLAEEIRDRLNGFLVASGVPPVRDVVIQDLVVSTP